mmetsp:Transcript_16487/g.30434  ORF Transcript_16487/g.30434 Transcript_16487/m.30434 type:complete len:89 (+) Transcript_16487:168-434(+)
MDLYVCYVLICMQTHTHSQWGRLRARVPPSAPLLSVPGVPPKTYCAEKTEQHQGYRRLEILLATQATPREAAEAMGMGQPAAALQPTR